MEFSHSSSQSRPAMPLNLPVLTVSPALSRISTIDDPSSDPWIDVDDGGGVLQTSPVHASPLDSLLSASASEAPEDYAASTTSEQRATSIHSRGRGSRGCRPRSSRRRSSPSPVNASPEQQTSRASSAWRKCKKVMKKHDRSLVAGWKEDVDTLLVFSGLFSAVLTAFVVESYTFLQPDAAGTSANILNEILVELRNISSPTRPSSGIATDPTFPAFSATSKSFAIRVNVLWFSSLVFSLASASIGILVKQWLRDYVSHSSGSSRHKARVRQLRYNGVLTFHIHEVIAFLPLLLQWSLGLFFIGLVDLLWSLNYIVSTIVTCFVVATLAFIVATTVLPALRADAPHRSPQALAVYLACKWAVRGAARAVKLLMKALGYKHDWLLLIPIRAFRNARRTRLMTALDRVLRERPHTSWREREKYLIADAQVALALDCQLLVGVDALYMDDGLLEAVVRPCVAEIPLPDAARCVLDILKNRAHGTVAGGPAWKLTDSLDQGLVTMVHMILDVLDRLVPSEREPDAEIPELLSDLEKLSLATHGHVDVPELCERIYSTLCRLLPVSPEVGDRAIRLLYNLKFDRATAVAEIDTPIITSIIAFARAAWSRPGAQDAYYRACVLALQFGAELSPAALSAHRPRLQALLRDLEANIKHAPPSPFLLVALHDLAARDRSLVHPRLLSALQQLLGLADNPGGQPLDAAVLRRLLDPRPVRKGAIFPPVEKLNQLGLESPEGTPSASTSRAGRRSPLHPSPS